jgi:hypothetical protein
MNKIWLLLTGFFLLSISIFSATEYIFDKNKDGKPDQWYEYEEGKILMERLDTNFDGVIDYKAEFDKHNHKVLEEFDINFDGKMDDIYFYENGKLVRQEIDTNYDGSTDLWIYLLEGDQIIRYEQDTDFDGKVDKVKKYGKE